MDSVLSFYTNLKAHQNNVINNNAIPHPHYLKVTGPGSKSKFQSRDSWNPLWLSLYPCAIILDSSIHAKYALYIQSNKRYITSCCCYVPFVTLYVEMFKSLLICLNHYYYYVTITITIIIIIAKSLLLLLLLLL